MDCRIDVPTESDAEAIARVNVTSWKETYGHLLPPGFFGTDHLEARVAQWSRRLSTADPKWTVRVSVSSARDQEPRIIGFALAGPPEDAEASPRGRVLYALYVLAVHHGTGVGQRLLEASLGDEPAVLWVEKTNARAITFYRRNGFDFDGAEQVDESLPGITAVRMVR